MMVPSTDRRRAKAPGAGSPERRADHDPVRAERALQRFEFIRSRPPVSADRALVFMAASGESVPYLPSHQPTRGELVGKNFRTLYEVEMGYQHLTFEHRLPSVGDAFFFHAETDVTWRVVKPGDVVEKGIRDVRVLLEPRLLARMRQETRRFAIEQSAQAETAVHDALALHPLAEAEGLEVTCSVRLSLDQQAIELHSKLRGVDYAKQQASHEHELDQLKARHLQQLTEERSRFNASIEADAALRGVDYALKRAKREHELDWLNTRHDHEITAERTRFYASMLESGEFERWGLHLSKNPQDIPLALQGLRDDEREASANQLQFVERLLDSGVVEDHQIAETARLAVETVKARLADAAVGRTRRRPLYREDPAAQLEKGRPVRPDSSAPEDKP
ncbi:hypothetical protein [Kitasatospora sp. McL0602]|uniref:hypothetical protein n=1 Tax=Kitasatospora sp. McL0602 TaxID=3439530 RepID=UPI003F8B525A